MNENEKFESWTRVGHDLDMALGRRIVGEPGSEIELEDFDIDLEDLEVELADFDMELADGDTFCQSSLSSTRTTLAEGSEVSV